MDWTIEMNENNQIRTVYCDAAILLRQPCTNTEVPSMSPTDINTEEPSMTPTESAICVDNEDYLDPRFGQSCRVWKNKCGRNKLTTQQRRDLLENCCVSCECGSSCRSDSDR
eukprot:UN34769